jgi:hypothetical protein
LAQQAQLENILDVLECDRGHHVTATRHRANQPVVGEAGQCHAHRRLAELVLFAELRFGHLGARCDQAADDVVLDAFVGALAEQGDGFCSSHSNEILEMKI